MHQMSLSETAFKELSTCLGSVHACQRLNSSESPWPRAHSEMFIPKNKLTPYWKHYFFSRSKFKIPLNQIVCLYVFQFAFQNQTFIMVQPFPSFSALELMNNWCIETSTSSWVVVHTLQKMCCSTDKPSGASHCIDNESLTPPKPRVYLGSLIGITYLILDLSFFNLS